LFARKPLISDALASWVIQNFQWYCAQRCGRKTPLVLPTRAFFSAPSGDDHDTARAVLDDLKRLLDIQARDFQLHPLPEIPEDLQRGYGELSEIAGTYDYDALRPVISYRPSMLRRPVEFINMMVHEVMHDKLALVVASLPGEEAAHELATDLHCITHGFGLFQLNGAEDAGWSGYMTQPSRAYALALFLRVNDIDPNEALGQLAPRAAKLVKRALRMERLSHDATAAQSPPG